MAYNQMMKQLVSVDGIQSGVPTLTTPTLTPTTLRSIEDTFIQLTNEPINAPFQAGFVPPSYCLPYSTSEANETESDVDSQASWNANHLNEENSMATTDTSSAATDTASFTGLINNSFGATSNASSTNDFTAINIALASKASVKNATSLLGNSTNNTSISATTTPRRNQGGRRPAKDTNMTPEEEEKRRIRRERNKLAAARCRKRRVDQTNELLDEVAQLERKREGLQKEIENLNGVKRDLEYVLEAHRSTCQKIQSDILTVHTIGGLIAPTNTNSNDSTGTITGLDTTLSSAGRSASPLDLKPNILGDTSVFGDMVHIKNEPLDTLDSMNSSLDNDDDGPTLPKRLLLSNNNPMIPMIPPTLPHMATITASLAAAASGSLNTPVVTTAPVSFASFSNTTLNALNKQPNSSRQRPNSLPTMPRNLAALHVDGMSTNINGVPIQTPTTGMLNFDSLMDGGTGLTPVSGPLVPTCSSQNKHPLELTTPTSEPSKLVSL
ncbi:transcription factor kayak-like [Teleopsis dalmanni]|uniref:transcription factor kayak-like n=1 Tax=Teleopsis dalmanni TaxID=139649 RepID=UPI0018CD56A3|nr:transcription factor kayak-like [Teleopsis dalmanni]